GVYKVANQMSSAEALKAITDQSNRVEHTALIREGISYVRAFEILSEVTGIPVEDFMNETKDLASFGIPAEAPSIEGYLFPATYIFPTDVSAHEVIKTMVDKMFSVLNEHGVAVEDRHKVLTMAGLIQREAGGNKEDFYKVSRVFQNRIDQGWKLQSDASVSYGTGNTGTVWTTAADRADGSNLYNTYFHQGLPIGPISLPGVWAIDAAQHPVDGPWMYFMAVDLRTGETGFAVTSSEHQSNVNKLANWCRVPDNAGYCGR
ncbi:MAG: endolytic transglycosylase MltG, partial [Microbacteriaceae bacterium]